MNQQIIVVSIVGLLLAAFGFTAALTVDLDKLDETGEGPDGVGFFSSLFGGRQADQLEDETTFNKTETVDSQGETIRDTAEEGQDSGGQRGSIVETILYFLGGGSQETPESNTSEN